MHLFHIRSLQIAHTVLLADALGRSMVLGGNERVAGSALLQTRQHVEDAALAIVQQQDAQVATQVLVPQRVLVVEETEVANDAEHRLVRHAGEACRRAERALDAVDAAIAPHRMRGIDIRQTNGRAVGVMN